MKFLFLLLFTVNAFALTESECRPVDMRERNKNIANNPVLKQHFTTPRNQDSVGWCYAFAAADLLSAEMSEPVSSLHASLIFNRNLEAPFITRDRINDKQEEEFYSGQRIFRYVYEEGSLNASIQAILRNPGICPERRHPFDQHNGRKVVELVREMEAIKSRIEFEKRNEWLVCQDLQSVLPKFGFNSLNVSAIGRALVSDEINKAMEKVVEANCSGSYLKVPGNLRTKMLLPKDKNYFSEINAMVSLGKPVAMNFDIKDVTSTQGRHINLITGRRWNNGRCEYKFRNSWGKSCAPFNADIDCNKEEGSFWVSEDFIRQKTFSAIYLHK